MTRRGKIRLATIYWLQVALGVSCFVTGVLTLFLPDLPVPERLIWAAVLGLLPGLCMIGACSVTR